MFEPFFYRLTIYYQDEVVGTAKSFWPTHHATYVFSGATNIFERLNTADQLGELAFGSAHNPHARRVQSVQLEEIHILRGTHEFEAYETDVGINYVELLNEYLDTYKPKPKQKEKHQKESEEFKRRNGGGMVSRGADRFTPPSIRKVK